MEKNSKGEEEKEVKTKASYSITVVKLKDRLFESMNY